MATRKPAAAQAAEPSAATAPASFTRAQRLPAELLYAEELAHLAAHDGAPRPPGWRLSMPAVRTFILGGDAAGRRIAPKLRSEEHV